MEEQVLNHIKEIIGPAKSFAILLDKNPEEYEVLCSEILKRTLSSKNIPFIALPQEKTAVENKWSLLFNFLKNPHFPAKTSLKLPKEKYGIKEIGYKEEGNNISLIITADNNSFSKEDVLLEPLLPEPEAALCFFENPSNLESFKDLIQPPNKDKVIFITSNNQTLTEKIFHLTKIINPSILEEEEINSLFWAALVSETDNFQKNSKTILSLGSLFLKNGADQENIEKINETEKQISRWQLLGRTLARTFIDETTNTCWSFLTSRDFQKTGRNPNIVSFLYKIQNQIKNIVKPQNLYILLWQTEEGVKALISAKERSQKNLMPIALQMKGTLQSYFFTIGPFESFSKAEIYIKKEVLKTRQD